MNGTALGSIPFVDTHVHFFDLDAKTGLRWEWAEGPIEGGLLPDTAAIRARRFLPCDLRAEGGRLGGMVKCVHVQATSEDGDPVAETRWLGQLRERFGAPHAAIARVALDEPDAADVLAAHCEFSWVRGVRDLGKTSLLDDPRYAAAVRLVGERGLVYEVVCGPRRFPALGQLAKRCPQTAIVLEHFGLPPRAGSDRIAAWRAALARLAQHDNVHIKLSGLTLCDPEWTFAHAADLVSACLETFGPDRCVTGSNFPIDRAGSSYPDVVYAILAACPDRERHRVLASNAETLYGI